MQALEADDPRSIGPFTVLARLGVGAMGAVYLARSAGGRPVAVKVIHAHLARDPGFRARFRREIDAARRVGGFWTAAVIDADIDAAMPWLATEYVPGPTLHDAVRDAGPLPDPTVRRLAAGIAEALIAIHATGLVHRDVKPGNVLLAVDGPRLIDFGITQALEAAALTEVGTVLGTAGYAAPEQVTGGSVGPPADVFGLGAVLVFAATGHGPYGSGTRTELLLRAAAGRPRTDGVPPWLHPLVTACLAADPGARPRPADVITAIGPVPDHASGGWLPEPVRTMVATRVARPSPTVVQPDAPPGASHERNRFLAAAGAASPGLVVHRKTSPAGTGGHGNRAAVAVFQASRAFAALRAALCLLGVVVSGGLSEGGPVERTLGAGLFLTSVTAGFVLLVGVIRRPRKLELDRDGILILRRGRHWRLPWAQISRIGVSGPRDPWLVLWPASPAAVSQLHSDFRRHHGGYRVYRVAPWRSRRRREAEDRELRAALAWYARTLFDPRL